MRLRTGSNVQKSNISPDIDPIPVMQAQIFLRCKVLFFNARRARQICGLGTYFGLATFTSRVFIIKLIIRRGGDGNHVILLCLSLSHPFLHSVATNFYDSGRGK